MPDSVLETLLSESSRLPEPTELPDSWFRLPLPELSPVMATLSSAAEAELLSDVAVLPSVEVDVDVAVAVFVTSLVEVLLVVTVASESSFATAEPSSATLPLLSILPPRGDSVASAAHDKVTPAAANKMLTLLIM